MATWRYVAHVKGAQTKIPEFVNPGEKTTLWDFGLKSDEEGLNGLDSFLNSRKKMFGAVLQWVALEKTDSDTDYMDSSANWVELKRVDL